MRGRKGWWHSRQPVDSCCGVQRDCLLETEARGWLGGELSHREMNTLEKDGNFIPFSFLDLVGECAHKQSGQFNDIHDGPDDVFDTIF